MSSKEIKKIVSIVSQRMQISRPLFVRVVPFRRKIASVSFMNGILRLNRDFISLANNYLLEYIIIHELVHIKLGHHYHNDEFYKEMKKYFQEGIDSYDQEIYRIMIKVNKKYNLSISCV